MIRRLIDWWIGVRVVEKKCFTYADADFLFKQQKSIHQPWRLSAMEDDNRAFGVVWLERVSQR